MSASTVVATLDVPGLIRRVRRVSDLSQADLAARLGVCQSTVARWETGVREPSLSMFQHLVALAGFELTVRDPATDQPASAMRSDGVRDRQGRRYPAHLDVLPSWPSPKSKTRDPDVTQCAPRRAWRDHNRAQENHFVPADHLSADEVNGVLEEWRKLRRRRCQRQAQQRREWARHEALLRGEPHPDIQEPCCCLDDCFLDRGCAPGCPCRCEPITDGDPPQTEQWQDRLPEL